MLTQEQKEYLDFSDKFKKSLFELNRDFSKLSEYNKARIGTELLDFVRIQFALKALEKCGADE